MDQLLINGGPIENSFDGLVRFMVVNATFSNISTISWRPVLVMTLQTDFYLRGRRDRDRMVVGFSTTCAISAYHH
jgi:hypothetical protein